MFCKKCGQQNDENAWKCVKCGQEMEQIQPAKPMVSIPNYLVQAILVTIFCCLPFGIPAIVFAGQVNGKIAAGDLAGAQAASKNAKLWSWVSFGVGLAVGLIYFIVVVAAGVSARNY